MPEISLTDWVDFVITAGPPQFTKVKELAARGEYDPRFDFWKPLREGLQSHHQGKAKLEGVLLGLKDPKKLKRYPNAIKAYQKFVGKKHLAWFKPPSAVWTYGGLTVRVNPELGLQFDGKKHVVKLYFKCGEALLQRGEADEAATECCAGNDAHCAQPRRKCCAGGLGCEQLSAGTPRLVEQDLHPMLQAQAIAFVHMWNAVSALPIVRSAASSAGGTYSVRPA